MKDFTVLQRFDTHLTLVCIRNNLYQYLNFNHTPTKCIIFQFCSQRLFANEIGRREKNIGPSL
jgi:hypothetical protein